MTALKQLLERELRTERVLLLLLFAAMLLLCFFAAGCATRKSAAVTPLPQNRGWHHVVLPDGNSVWVKPTKT